MKENRNDESRNAVLLPFWAIRVPVEQLKRARKSGISWQDVYTRDADVRTFVDALLEMISRG